MKRALSTSLACLVLAAGADAAVTTYMVVDLGALPASSVCPCFSPTGMSETGHVAGTYFAPSGERRSFRWTGTGIVGAMQDIGTLGGIAQGLDVNNSGLVVGYSVDLQGRQRAIKFDGQAMTDIGTLHGGVHANANAVGNQGWIVGMSQRQFGNETWQRATLWIPGQGPMDLGSFGGPYAEAFGVNDVGQVVGWAWNSQWRQRAFVWSAPTGMVDIGTLGGVMASAADINEHGAVVGVADTASNLQRAYIWTPAGGMVELPSPPNAFSSYATALNNAGQVVGNAFLDTCQGVGLLWSGGQVYDVNTLVAPGSGWVIDGASDIADDGKIAASGRLNGGPYHAVLLVPVKAGATGARPTD